MNADFAQTAFVLYGGLFVFVLHRRFQAQPFGAGVIGFVLTGLHLIIVSNYEAGLEKSAEFAAYYKVFGLWNFGIAGAACVFFAGVKFIPGMMEGRESAQIADASDNSM